MIRSKRRRGFSLIELLLVLAGEFFTGFGFAALLHLAGVLHEDDAAGEWLRLGGGHQNLT